jgi:hypothetical protein
LYEAVRYKLVDKFEEELLLSCCISPAGISLLVIRRSKQAVNRWVYLDILKETLLPLVDKYYAKKKDWVFWPDLASAHYAKEVSEFLKSKKLYLRC